MGRKFKDLRDYKHYFDTLWETAKSSETFIYKFIQLVVYNNTIGETMQEVIHYPNLKTMLMVEKVLKDAETTLTREEIKEKLPTQIMHQTLNVILDYMEQRGLILDGHKGVLWTHNDSPKLREAISKGTEI